MILSDAKQRHLSMRREIIPRYIKDANGLAINSVEICEFYKGIRLYSKWP